MNSLRRGVAILVVVCLWPFSYAFAGGPFSSSFGSVLNSGKPLVAVPAVATSSVTATGNSGVATRPTHASTSSAAFQRVSADVPTFQNTTAVSCPARAYTKGNLVVVAVESANNASVAATAYTASDTQSNSISQVAPIKTLSVSSTRSAIQLFKFVAANSLSDIVTVTVTAPGGPVATDIQCTQYSGNDPSGAVDAHVETNASGLTSSVTSGSLISTVASDLLFCALVDGLAGDFQPGANFSNIGQNYMMGGAEDNANIAVGTYRGTATLDVSTNTWQIACALFRPAVSSGTASLSAASLSFSGQLVETISPPQAITLSNIGNATLNITSIVPSGDFSQTNTCGTSLAVGGSCVINVNFTPIASWTRGGSVLITDDSSNGATQLILLTGMGNSGAVGNIAPTSLSFGNQNIGSTSAAKTFTLTNNGNAVLNISSLVASGDYAQTNNCGTSLSVSASCKVTVNFAPSSTGVRNGWVTIFDTDASLLQTVTLTGTGTVAATTVVVSPKQTSITPSFTQQFVATVGGDSSGSVTWAVDGVVGGNSTVGTISKDGLYTPPAKQSKHKIKATSVNDSTQSATVPLVVTNYPGTFTQKNDNLRTGLNTRENVLTTGNVNQKQFGKLFTYPVDGYVYAQPLYVANVNIPSNGTHSVLYIATEHDSVYAFDADNLAPTTLWQTSFTNPAQGITTIPAAEIEQGNDLVPEIGITGTPVIDQVNKTLFVVARTKEVTNNVTSYVQRLHAIDITTGAEEPGSPVLIQAKVSGTGAGSRGGNISFDGKLENSRPALLLDNGVIYIAWGSLEDIGNFHGWIIGFNENTLLQDGVWLSTANGRDGGIWQGGGGLAADASGNIFFATGNGTMDANTGGVDYGDSVVRLNPSAGALTVADYFSPYNQASLSIVNWDLCAGGTLLLPDQPGAALHLALVAGKGGTVYLLNRDNLGHFSATANQNVMTYPALVGPVTEIGGNRGGPAYWNGQVYYAGASDHARQFGLFNGLMSSTPMAVATKFFGYPGGAPAISANGNTNGIVWILQTDGFNTSNPAILRAFDAANITRELYDSTLNKTRDQAGPAVKFSVPTVANGKVYVGTETQVNVYGLLP
jgi:hypothetical protein